MMTTLVLELQPEVYQRLQVEAAQNGKAPEILAAEWVSTRLPAKLIDEKARAREVLRAAGLLTELGPELQRMAAQSVLSLDEAQAIFAHIGGKPLSEIVIEQRGPKE